MCNDIRIYFNGSGSEVLAKHVVRTRNGMSSPSGIFRRRLQSIVIIVQVKVISTAYANLSQKMLYS